MHRTIPFLVARAGQAEEEEEVQANVDPFEDDAGEPDLEDIFA